MKSFERAHVETLLERLAEEPRTIIAVFGPRQVGKSTLVRQALRRLDSAHYRYVAVEAPGTPEESSGPTRGSRSAGATPAERSRAWLYREWQEARKKARAHGRFVLVLDEIQRIPNWSAEMTALWDEDRWEDCPLHVVILGSTPIHMQAGVSADLVGRFEPFSVTHWTFAEMRDAFGFNLGQHLYFGGYPGGAERIGDLGRWRKYMRDAVIRPTVERDLLALGRVSEPALLWSLFSLTTDYSGQILSPSKMRGQLPRARNGSTLAGYLNHLERIGLVAALRKYSNKPHLAHLSVPKLCVLNPALLHARPTYSPVDAMADRKFWGRVVESAVGAHLYNGLGPSLLLHYWRDDSHEVDFVLSNGHQAIAIEVKSGERRRSRHRGMEEFSRRFRPIRQLEVGPRGVPLEEFLSLPPSHWFHPEAESVGHAGDGEGAQVKEAEAPYRTTGLFGPRPRPATARESQVASQVRREVDELLNGGGSALVLDELARLYFHSRGRLGQEGGHCALEYHLGHDPELLRAAFAGLRGVAVRGDSGEVSPVPEGEDLMFLRLPLFVGMTEVEKAGGRPPEWTDEQLHIALEAYLPLDFEDFEPAWYGRLLQDRPEFLGKSILRIIPAWMESEASPAYFPLHALAFDPRYGSVARGTALDLARTIPPHSLQQHEAHVRRILWAAFRHAEPRALESLIVKKLSLSSLTDWQRTYWLAAGLAFPSLRYAGLLERHAGDDWYHLFRITEFFDSPRPAFGLPATPSPPPETSATPDSPARASPIERLDEAALSMLIRRLGSHFEPVIYKEFAGPSRMNDAALLAEELVHRLAALRSDAAVAALTELRADEALHAWRDRLQDALGAAQTGIPEPHPPADAFASATA